VQDALQALERVIAGSAADEVEHDRLDFKCHSDSRNDTVSGLADAAVCFANATGATVVLGVADSATSCAIWSIAKSSGCKDAHGGLEFGCDHGQLLGSLGSLGGADGGLAGCIGDTGDVRCDLIRAG
jgi:hypothetical protein